MSFEVFLACYHAGNPAGVPRSEIHDLFDAHVSAHSEPDWWDLVYDWETTCSLSLQPMDGDNELIHWITVHRPCGDRRFWQFLLQLMTKGNVVLFFPGDSPPLVAKASVAAHMPAARIESLGQPVVVADPDEILMYIQTA